MRRLASTIRNLFGKDSGRRPARSTRRLQIEALEDRSLPAAILGVAYIDANTNGVRDAGEFGLSGHTVNLNGTTNQGDNVQLTATTDAGGGFFFLNLRAGVYRLTTDTASGLLSSPSGFLDNRTTPPITLVGDETVTVDLPFGGLAPQMITARQFLSNTTPAYFPFFQPGGNGTASANNAPFLKNDIPNISAHPNGDTISLAGFFSDPDLSDTFVRIDTILGPINVELFDQQAPQTVAHFLNYVNSGTYNSAIFHRLTNLASDGLAVLQGGGFYSTVTSTTPADLNQVPVLGIPNIPSKPAHVTGPNGEDGIGVPNEFFTPNTTGTLAMAKLGGDPNSATNQFFFNLADNAQVLGAQNNGGFTVFGRVVSNADLQVLNALAAIPTQDKSTTNGNFKELPLINYNGSQFPTDTQPNNFELITGVSIISQNERLTYSVIGNSNPALVTATIQPNSTSFLNLTYPSGQKGTATITVQVADRFGATATTSFDVNVT